MKVPSNNRVTKRPVLDAGKAPLAWLRKVGHDKIPIDDVLRATSWIKGFEDPVPALAAKPLKDNLLSKLTVTDPDEQQAPATPSMPRSKRSTHKVSLSKARLRNSATVGGGKRASCKGVNAPEAKSPVLSKHTKRPSVLPHTFPTQVSAVKLQQVCEPAEREVIRPAAKEKQAGKQLDSKVNGKGCFEHAASTENRRAILKGVNSSAKNISQWRSRIAWRAARIKSDSRSNPFDNSAAVKAIKRAWDCSLDGPSAPLSTLLASCKLQEPVTGDSRYSGDSRSAVPTTSVSTFSIFPSVRNTVIPATEQQHHVADEAVKGRYRTSTPSAEHHAVVPVVPVGSELLGLATATKAELQHSDVVAPTPIGPAVNTTEHTLHTKQASTLQVYEPELAEQLKRILDEEARRHGISV